MRRQRGLVGLTGLATLVGLGMFAQPAMSGVTTEQSASILVFPKVIANGTRDTVIQITNTSNVMRHAHCFYVDGAPVTAGLPPGPLNPPSCTEIDFDIWLTKQQPTHWVVSRGRQVYPSDLDCRGHVCNPATSGGPRAQTDVAPAIAVADCCDAGIDPGRVPPVAPDFTGELKCIEVDSSGAPESGNALKGEATIEDPTTGDVSKYNAVGFVGNNNNNGDNVLCLGNSSAAGDPAACPLGAEYSACPASWYLDTTAVGAIDPVLEDNGIDSSVGANLTVVPCTENFETQVPTSVTLQFVVINEFEQSLSTSTTVTCWASWDLGSQVWSDVFNTGTLGGKLAQTRMRSATGTPRGVLAVVEETHTELTTGGLTARSAQNGHTSFQDQPGLDKVTIPGDQLLP
ncbi:MAG: hypothetical protein ACHQ9S_03955 [Candidatus Binatia bacterium]